MIIVKTCIICCVEKDEKEFYQRKGWKNTITRNNRCKKCMDAKTREWRKENPIRWKELRERYREQNKEKLIESNKRYYQENREMILAMKKAARLKVKELL